MTDDARIRRAIETRTLLEFDYDDHHRIVAPYCYGVTTRMTPLLRGIQIGGASRSGSFGMGKLWHVSKMLGVRNTDEKFLPVDPDYNPEDEAITEIYCRV